MKRPSQPFALAVCLAAAAFPLSAQSPAAGEGFGEVVEVNVINLDVHVTDKAGRPVTDLDRDDFEVLEDGKRVPITNFQVVRRGAAPAAAAVSVPAQAPAAPRAEDVAEAAPAASAAESTAAAAPDPLHLVVFVDNVNTRPAHRTRALRQIRDFLARELRAGDQVMVATFDPALRVRQPFTGDPAVVARALDEVTRLGSSGGEIDRSRRTALDAVFSIQSDALKLFAMESSDPSDEIGTAIEVPCPLRIADPVKSFAESSRHNVLQAVNALKTLVNSLSGLPGRKAVLHVSDGISLTPGEELFQVLQEMCGGGGVTSGVAPGMTATGDPDSAATIPQDARRFGARAYQASQAMIDAQSYSTAKDWAGLAAHANTHRVTLYTLQASGAEAPASSQADSSGTGPDKLLRLGSVSQIETTNRRGSLNVMAADTGGRAVFDANDLLPELARIQQDFSSYYSLAFTPRKAGDSREHRLEVRVKQKGLEVRHPSSYRAKSAGERVVDRMLAALLHGSEDNALEVAMEIGEATPAAGGNFSVPVRVKIPLHKLLLDNNETNMEGKVRLLVAVQGPGGTTSRIRTVDVPIKIPSDKALVALGQSHLYELTLTLPAGEQRVAVAVQDAATAQSSYLARAFRVGGGEGAVRGQR